MGNCCTTHTFASFTELVFKSKLTEAQKQLGLDQIQIKDWALIFRDLVIHKNLTLSEMEQQFPLKWEFKRRVQEALQDQETLVSRLFKHQSFKSKQGNDLDPKKVFSLGIVYCTGNAQEMVDAIFHVYDRNLDYFLFVNVFRKIFRQAVLVAVCLVPALIYNIDIEEAVDQTYDEVQNITQDLVMRIFKNELKLTQQKVLEEWKFRKVGEIITNSSNLRDQAKVKIRLGRVQKPEPTAPTQATQE